MSQIFNPNNPPFRAPVLPPPKGGTAGPTGASPGLLASTGGLFGSSGSYLIPIMDQVTGSSYFMLQDPSNFNTEEACIYAFPQENIKPGYSVTIEKLSVLYRNLGVFTATFSITCFRRGISTYSKNKVVIAQGSYKTKSVKVTLGSALADGLLYEQDVNLVLTGERPQISISRIANSGPMSIISILMIGNVSEDDKGT